jgi:hypothetical protein
MTTNAATTTTTTTTPTSAVNTETGTTVAAAPAATLTTAEDFAKAGKFADVTRLLKQDHAAYNRGEKAADISDRLESSVFGAYKKSADYTALQTWLGNGERGDPGRFARRRREGPFRQRHLPRRVRLLQARRTSPAPPSTAAPPS